MAKIALLGATGNVGRRILDELVARGHQVTALARRVTSLPAHSLITPRSVDAGNEAELVAALTGHDAVISALPFLSSDPDLLIRSVKAAGVARYLVVGGAGSLEVAPGVKLLDVPDFPAIYLAEATRGSAFLDRLRKEPAGLDWTMLSPAALFVPGERTGHFRLADDELLTDGAGNSTVSLEDYAVALANEVEHPAHSRRRFAIAY